MNRALRKYSVFVIAAVVAACSQPVANTETASQTSALGQADLQTKSLVSFKLTDAPNKDLKSVIFDIDHMEVLVAGASKAGRLILAKGLGPVDLLTLQNGVTLPLQDVVAPAGIQIQQIRLVLKEQGHYAVKADGSICEMKTPSAQKTGVKIILTNKVQFEAGHQYDVVVDFDALKSVVVQGNGRCLLKPVLKLKSAYKKPIVVEPAPDSDENGDGDDVAEDSSAEDSSGNSEDGSEGSADGSFEGGVSNGSEAGSDSGTENGGEADSGSAEVVVDDGAASDSGDPVGEELVVLPEQNDPAGDGWDYTPIIDGESYPVITQDELSQLL